MKRNHRALGNILQNQVSLLMLKTRVRKLSAAVCHGAAMLAAMAASTSPEKDSKSLWEIMGQMSKPGRRVDPTNDAKEQDLLQAKFEVFLDMCSRQREYRELVDNRLSGATEKIIL